MPALITGHPIILDQPRSILYRKGGVKHAEKALADAYGPGCTFYSALQDIAQLLSTGNPSYLVFGKLAILLWAGLLHDDEALTLDATEDMMPVVDIAGLAGIAEAVLLGWTASSPQASDAPARTEEATDPLASSPGKLSGALSVAS